MELDRKTLAGVALICFGNLLLEIVITRLFSATMFYHFTFLAVGLALFGVAASGVWVFVNEERLAADVRGQLVRNSRRFAIAALVALIYSLTNPIDIIFISGTSQVPDFTKRQFWQLVILIAVTAAPFFFSGAVVSLSLTYFKSDTNRVYSWDLAGAAIAALLAGPFLGLLGGPSCVFAVAVMGLAAAALFDRGSRAKWIWPAVGVVALVVNLTTTLVAVPTVKGVKSGTLAYEHWNTFSRVTVDTSKTIKIDASAATHIEDLRTLNGDTYKPQISALAYSVFAQSPAQVLIIGPGGGRDVLFALSAGTAHVTGVEVNPIIAETIMGDLFAKDSGGLYQDPRVRIVVDDGRSFVRRSDDHYDLVQASLVDTWAATAAGAFALTENTLYTMEAFEDYYEHLSPTGVLTMTRWHTGEGGESARLLILAAAALEKVGVPHDRVRRHIFYAVSTKDGLGTLIAKRDELGADEIARLQQRCLANKWNVIVSPDGPSDGLLVRYVDAGADSDLVADAPEELHPPTDDRPFFFFFRKFSGLFPPSRQMNDPGLWILVSVGSVLGLSAFFILLPLIMRMIRKQQRGSAEERKSQAVALGFFGVVGLAFMTVEMALLQRFTLFLGHPSYSLIVILFALLLSTAAGASLSGRWAPARLGKLLLIVGAAVALLMIVYGLFLGDVLRSMIGLAIALRMIITVLLVAPAGILMGAVVPSGIRVLGGADSPLVPWAWGVNGATSVLGTVVGTVVAIYNGFTATFLVGAIAYAIAGGLGVLMARRYAPRAAA